MWLPGLEFDNKGRHKACFENEDLKPGLNMIDGTIVYKGVADAFGHNFKNVDDMI